MDESQAGLREQSASQLSVIIPCPPAGSVISSRIQLSLSSFVSLSRTHPSYNPSLNSIAISKPSHRTASDLEQCMLANQLNNPGLG